MIGRFERENSSLPMEPYGFDAFRDGMPLALRVGLGLLLKKVGVGDSCCGVSGVSKASTSREQGLGSCSLCYLVLFVSLIIHSLKKTINGDLIFIATTHLVHGLLK